MDSLDLATTSATEVARAIRDREVSPTEVMQATIERVERVNPAVNALVHKAFDEAMTRAAEADQQVALGRELGPLHGVPTAIKDLFEFKPGWPATLGGIPALRDHTVDATCVWAQRMEAAGAIIIGKTNAPVLGFRGTTDNPLFGPTSTPFDLGRNAGGSSGGAAAAVASGMLPFAEGTDVGGSVRIPAAWCGVVGFKQSWGRVPVVPRPNAFGGTNPFGFEGVLTRSAEDLGTMLAVLSGPDPRDPYARSDRFDDIDAHQRGINGLRVAYSPDFGGFPVEPRVREVVDSAVAALEQAGAVVEQVGTPLPRDQFQIGELWCRLVAPRNLFVLDRLAVDGIDLLAAHRDQLPGQLLRYVDEATRMTVRDFEALQVARTEVFDFVQSFLPRTTCS
ncbi:amidase family protein [Intrasporangium sp.]|uniref:amidase n=1 Tax=Intrasporangium sp. TaxID=1925024 RepID=UPI003221A6D5